MQIVTEENEEWKMKNEECRENRIQAPVGDSALPQAIYTRSAQSKLRGEKDFFLTQAPWFINGVIILHSSCLILNSRDKGQL